jgi:hypothetical protein
MNRSRIAAPPIARALVLNGPRLDDRDTSYYRSPQVSWASGFQAG